MHDRVLRNESGYFLAAKLRKSLHEGSLPISQKGFWHPAMRFDHTTILFGKSLCLLGLINGIITYVALDTGAPENEITITVL